jgi:nicotinate-nucleotide pyrophosphorylase (carboxylating)
MTIDPTIPNILSDAVGDGRVTRLIEEAILEDLGVGDITTDGIVSHELPGRGDILVKETGVIAGLSVAGLVFQFIDPEIVMNLRRPSGSRVEAGTVVATAEGSFASLLKAERTALNILQRMSGIATLTAKFVDAVKGTNARITDTRKTPPGLRILDKLAVRVGGGINHRFGLDDMALIKDNHIAAAGGIGPAIERCLQYLQGKKYSVRVEIETKNLDEVQQVLKYSGIHRIMLDHFSLDEMKRAVQLIDHKLEVEASGNVSLENVHTIAETGVDVISVGALTHSPKALDISMKITNLSKSHT